MNNNGYTHYLFSAVYLALWITNLYVNTYEYKERRPRDTSRQVFGAESKAHNYTLIT